MKKLLLATAMSIACLTAAHATDYRFFCTNHSDPEINPDRDGVFVAVTSGTAQSFDVMHSIGGHHYDRRAQYKVTSLTHPASNSYFWEGFMLKDPHVIMTGHLWENEGVWMYTENQTFTDERPPKMATPPVVCRNTVDIRSAKRAEIPAEGDEVPAPNDRPPSLPPYQPPPPRYSQASLPDCNDFGGSQDCQEAHLVQRRWQCQQRLC